ncbi:MULTISPECIES: hypothetical protein [Rhizobium]|uniref:Uncharacterized protein n=1 Tax=Rhizobium favelukesii TaxID=348824 RepID=W6RIX8_9HYPH|nr:MULTISPECIES: hypothetical protein [Rhizobium]MCA0807399.1 hypothetical protein [Rhizobium sp. T1473]MCS0463479.1 hypothetical protein [Rhizobium favelukesii]UFS84679.1 hypothetical protein LPB79_32975 [Rhizobium sp. T136]CDM60265.1 hypothetical protein LPU83_pLPU83b_0275 [Rhizobium favelukesii]
MPEGASLNIHDFARIFRLIAAAKEGAEALELRNLVHLTNMALLQVALDWDGLDPESVPDTDLGRLVGEKARIATSGGRENLLVLHHP